MLKKIVILIYCNFILIYRENDKNDTNKSNTTKSTTTELKFHSWWQESSIITKPIKRDIELTYHIDSNTIDIEIPETDQIYTAYEYETIREKHPIYLWDLYVGSHFHLLGRYTSIMQVSNTETEKWLSKRAMLLVDYRDSLRDRVIRYKPSGVKRLGTLDPYRLSGETNTHHVVWQINLLINELKQLRPNMHLQILKQLRKKYHVKEELIGITL